MRELEIDDKHYPVNGVANRISAAKNELLSASDVRGQGRRADGQEGRRRSIARYQARLLAANAMDFDDLLVNAYRLLSRAPEDVLRAYQQRFRYISVDEYQDTNHAQYRSRTCSRADTATSWSSATTTSRSTRGAAPTSATSSSSSATIPQAVVVKLEQNYRSTARILAAANAVVANNPNRKPKTLFTANAEGEKIASYLASDERDEARFIAGEIERLVRAERPRATPTSPSSTAPTPSRACSKTRCCAPACPTGSSAARASSTAPRSATSWRYLQGRREPRRRDLAQAHHQHAQARHRRHHRRARRRRRARAARSASRTRCALAVEDDRLQARTRDSARRLRRRSSTSCARWRATCATSSRWSSRAPASSRRSKPRTPTRRAVAPTTSASSSASSASSPRTTRRPTCRRSWSGSRCAPTSTRSPRARSTSRS